MIRTPRFAIVAAILTLLLAVGGAPMVVPRGRHHT